MASARGSATREAIIRRSEPLQLQLWVRILPAIAPKRPLSGRAMGVLQIARWWNSAPDLPDVSKCFSQDSLKASMPTTTMLLCMGLFSIFWLGASTASGLRLSFPMMIAGWPAEP